MKKINRGLTAIGLGLLILSQLLLARGYDFLMSQNPIDFAHWSLLLAAVLLLSLWGSLSDSKTKVIGLSIMTLGMAGIIGMCTIDFILWASHGNSQLKEEIFRLISGTASINFPFLVLGPALFYTGICVATYGLFNKFRLAVVAVNLGGLLVGLAFMVLQNAVFAVVGALILSVGMLRLLNSDISDHSA